MARADERSLALGKGLSLPFVEVPAGTFTQGSPPDEVGREADETPREVTLTQAYYLSKYPITVGEFSAFVEDTQYRTEAEKGQSGGSGWDGQALVQKPEFTWKSPGFSQTNQHPVVLVTYDDALAFAHWVEKKTGEPARLPTEAEFEKAARGSETKFSTSWAEAKGFLKGSGVGTHLVGEKPANALGLFGMVGNINQWTSDGYTSRTSAEAIDPSVPEAAGSPPRRVLKGGSWNRDPRRGRPAARFASSAKSRSADNGFRLAFGKSKGPALKVGTGSQGEAPLTLGGPKPGDPLTTTTTTTTPSSDRSLAPLLLPVAALGAFGVLFFALRRKNASVGDGGGARVGVGGLPGGDSNVTTRMQADGFVIVASLPPGSRVKYEAFVKGVPVTDVVPIDGPETFVYTGGAPEMVRILDVLAGQANYRGPSVSGSNRHSSRRSPPGGGSGSNTTRDVLVVHDTVRRDESVSNDSTPFYGNPSAY